MARALPRHASEPEPLFSPTFLGHGTDDAWLKAELGHLAMDTNTWLMWDGRLSGRSIRGLRMMAGGLSTPTGL